MGRPPRACKTILISSWITVKLIFQNIICCTKLMYLNTIHPNHRNIFSGLLHSLLIDIPNAVAPFQSVLHPDRERGFQNENLTTASYHFSALLGFPWVSGQRQTLNLAYRTPHNFPCLPHQVPFPPCSLFPQHPLLIPPLFCVFICSKLLDTEPLHMLWPFIGVLFI